MNFNNEIDEFIKRKHYRQINSVLLCKDGEMIAQRYYNGFDENSRNVIKSVAKSILSICVGIALDKGLIQSLDDPIARFIPQFSEGRERTHSVITIRHLLTMTSGIYWTGGVHYHCPMFSQMRRSGDWLSHILDCSVTDMPGTRYNYKEWDIILLAKVLDCAYGDMFDFLNDNLYKPLGIESQRWYKSQCGIYYSVADSDQGADESKSNLTALEMLRIGQLFLNDGMFLNKRILSEEYIKEAVSPSKCNSHYGFMWWIGEDWYECRGFGGQDILVVPKKNVTAVIQATPTSRGMAYDDLIWHCLSKM